MQTVGRKIYYEKETGAIVYNSGERSGTDITPTTVEEDFSFTLELKGKTPDEIGVLILSVGEYAEEFEDCLGYKVNTETNELEFLFASDEQTNVPAYEEPLEVRLLKLEQENQKNLQRIAELELTITEILASQ